MLRDEVRRHSLRRVERQPHDVLRRHEAGYEGARGFLGRPLRDLQRRRQAEQPRLLRVAMPAIPAPEQQDRFNGERKASDMPCVVVDLGTTRASRAHIASQNQVSQTKQHLDIQPDSITLTDVETH